MDEMTKRKLLGLLGFAARARMLETGAGRIADSVRKHDVFVKGDSGRMNAGVVIVASDASPNTVKRLKNCCSYYNTECVSVPVTMEELAHTVGKASDTSAVGLFAGSFPASVKKLLREAGLTDGGTEKEQNAADDLNRTEKGVGDTL